MVFYLKINREEKYTKRNLQQWIDVIKLFEEPTIIIQCDKEALKAEMLERVEFYDLNIEWINTEFDNAELTQIVRTMAPEWEKASYAHLTTFLDIKRRNTYNDPGFFNIDADDTFFCMKPTRVHELLLEAMKEAETRGIDLLSFDMWYSRSRGTHWSFGVTYVRNTIDYMKTCVEASRDDAWKNSKQPRNVDGYFNFLHATSRLTISSFYCENVRFIHYSNDFFRRLWTSSFYHYNKGKLYFPLFEIAGMHDLSSYDIPLDDICIDIDLLDIEYEEYMFMCTVEPDKTALMVCSNRSIEDYEKRIDEARQKNVKR